MKSYSFTYASCCAFVIITGWCLEDSQVPTPCVHHEDACADVEFESTENDVVNLLQKQATVLQRQAEELRLVSTGSRVEKNDKSHVAKTLDKVKGQRDWTTRAVAQVSNSGLGRSLLASVFRVDRVQTKESIGVCNIIAFVCVGLAIVGIFVRKCLVSRRKRMEASIARETAPESSTDVKDADGEPEEEDKFWVAKFGGLLLSLSDANDFMVITFLPSYLASRGVTKFQVGLSFSALGISIMLMSLRIPYIVKTLKGQKLGVWYGMRFYSLTRLPFMILIFLPDGWLVPVVIMAFILSGIAYTFLECCGTAWTLGSVEASERTSALGMLQGGRVLGSLAGPALGGVLYNFLGFTVPFALGFLALIALQETCREIFNFEEEVQQEEEDDADARKDSVMRSPGVIVCQLFVCLLTANMLAQFVWMQFNVEDDYGFQPWEYSLLTVGVTFLLGLSMGMITPMLEVVIGPFKTIIIGVVLLSASYLIMGPSPWLSFLPTGVWLPVLGFILWGFALSFAFGIVGALSMNIAIGAGWSELDASVQIASLQALMMGAGITIGPPIFMGITQQVGIRPSSTILAFGHLIVLGGLWLILVLLNPKVATGVESSDEQSGNPEVTKSSLSR